MEKKEYVSPELEVVEIVEQCGILAGSGDEADGDFNPGVGPRG